MGGDKDTAEQKRSLCFFGDCDVVFEFVDHLIDRAVLSNLFLMYSVR